MHKLSAESTSLLNGDDCLISVYMVYIFTLQCLDRKKGTLHTMCNLYTNNTNDVFFETRTDISLKSCFLLLLLVLLLLLLLFVLLYTLHVKHSHEP